MVTMAEARDVFLFAADKPVVSQETKLILVLRAASRTAGIHPELTEHCLTGSGITWFDRIRSHMHTGFVTHEFETTSFLDLSYSYPYV